MTSGDLRASIIIPAHDEGTIIGRLLSGIAELAADHDVLVVTNGCTDDTAEVVRRFPWCRLIEVPEASKVAALNAGDAAALAFPRVYLDADVTVSAATLRSLVALLDGPEAIVASPAVRVDASGASVFARAYQRVWALTDYRLENHTGSGIYGLSEAGRARFGAFPDIISDDLYVRLLFAPHERRVSAGEPFTVFAPRTARAQVRRLSRAMAGELQLAQRFPELQDA
jgi:glycosyltransferase involved in cell wall biosynthesis